MDSPWTKLFERVRAVLHASAEFEAQVPTANVFPENDPGTERAGNLAIMSTANSHWDRVRRRGQVTFRLEIQSINSASQASAILEKAKKALTEESISDDVLSVHLWDELPEGEENRLVATQRMGALAQWKVLLTA